MNNFLGIIQNKYIYVPFLLWFFIQLYKVIYDLITTKKFNFKRIIGAGGMPSSHSAIVVSLATMIGAAGKQAALLNKIIETPGLTGVQVSERLVEVLGHTPVQVFVGALLGVIVGIIA